MSLKTCKQCKRLLLLLTISTLAASWLPAKAASEDDTHLARRYLRCAAFYLSGANEVSKPELRQQLQQLTNLSLYSAEILLDKNRPLVKEEFETAKTKLREEVRSDEIRADSRAFMEYMGAHCAELRKTHPVALPKSGS